MRTEVAILAFLAAVVVVWLGIKLFDREPQDSNDWVIYCAKADSVLRPASYSTRWTKNSRFEGYKPYVVEINRADSMALVRVYGIGATFASRILQRREALGGFYAIEQLNEIRGITSEVFARVAKSFLVDSGAIKKININFAPLNVLGSHPYFSPSMVRRIEAERMKGGFFRNHKELIDKDILLPKEARRVAPYLSF